MVGVVEVTGGKGEGAEQGRLAGMRRPEDGLECGMDLGFCKAERTTRKKNENKKEEKK